MAEQILIQHKSDPLPVYVNQDQFDLVFKDKGYTKVSKTDEEKALEKIASASAIGANTTD